MWLSRRAGRVLPQWPLEPLDLTALASEAQVLAPARTLARLLYVSWSEALAAWPWTVGGEPYGCVSPEEHALPQASRHGHCEAQHPPRKPSEEEPWRRWTCCWRNNNDKQPDARGLGVRGEGGGAGGSVHRLWKLSSSAL